MYNAKIPNNIKIYTYMLQYYYDFCKYIIANIYVRTYPHCIQYIGNVILHTDSVASNNGQDIYIHIRDAMIHDLGVSIYCHFVSRYSDIFYNTVKYKLADFYR